MVKEIGWGLRPQLSVSLEREVHDARFALFGRTRREWRTQVTAAISKRDWSVRGLAPSLRVSYARSASTLELDDQRRLRAEFALAKAF